MMEYRYYILLLVAVIVGFVAVKKIAGCLLRTVTIAVLIGILGVLYWVYARQ